MNLGIVGAGMIVHDFLEMHKELPEIKLLGITARHEQKLKELCDQYPIAHYYMSYDEMLENSDIETI